jgi:hypothetical protein
MRYRTLFISMLLILAISSAPTSAQEGRGDRRGPDKHPPRGDRRHPDRKDHHRPDKSHEMTDEQVKEVGAYLAKHWAQSWHPRRKQMAQMIARLAKQNAKAHHRYLIRRIAPRIYEEKRSREHDPEMFKLKDGLEQNQHEAHETLGRFRRADKAGKPAIKIKLRATVKASNETKIQLQELQVQRMEARLAEIRKSAKNIDPRRLELFEAAIVELKQKIEQMKQIRDEQVEERVAAMINSHTPHPEHRSPKPFHGTRRPGGGPSGPSDRPAHPPKRDR